MLSFPSGMHGVGDALRADAETLLERVREPLGDLLHWSTEAVVDGSVISTRTGSGSSPDVLSVLAARGRAP